MKPILVYSKEEAARNKFVVEIFKKELGATLVTPNYRGKADFVINRTNDYTVAEFYEKQGVRVFNPSGFSKLANNKQLCYDFMEKSGIQIMPTRYGTPPFVKKPIDGHGGRGVVMCNSSAQYDEQMVCQKPAGDLGKDFPIGVDVNDDPIFFLGDFLGNGSEEDGFARASHAGNHVNMRQREIEKEIIANFFCDIVSLDVAGRLLAKRQRECSLIHGLLLLFC